MYIVKSPLVSSIKKKEHVNIPCFPKDFATSYGPFKSSLKLRQNLNKHNIYECTLLKRMNVYWSCGWILFLENYSDDWYIIDRRGWLYEAKGISFIENRFSRRFCFPGRTPLRHGAIELLMRSWNLSQFSRRALSNSWRVCTGFRWPAISLPRISQTCYTGFMSGEHAGYSIRMIPS